MLWQAGAATIGLVCGWWSAPLLRASAPWRSWSAAAAAMSMVGVETAGFAGARAAFAFAVGFGGGLGTHAAFRAWLATHLVNDRGASI
jgi:hypothetical protein